MPTAFITFGGNQLHDVASGGGVGVGAGTNAPNNTDVKSYVDAVAQGLKTKGIATAVVLANVASLTGLAAIGDGVTLGTDGMIALLTAQTTGSQNGAWVVHAGAWTRPANFAAGSSAAGAFWIVEQGTLYHDTGWVCSTDPPSDVVDTNSLALSMFFSATALANADGTLIFLGTDVRRAPITGDVSVPGGSNVATLASTAVLAASYGDASHVATFTVDVKGRLTAAGSVAIAIGAGAVSGLAAIATSGSANDLGTGTMPAGRMPGLTGDVTSSAGAVATTLASTGVAAATYGDASHVAQVALDMKGRATAASNVLIQIDAARVVSGNLANARLPNAGAGSVLIGIAGGGYTADARLTFDTSTGLFTAGGAASIGGALTVGGIATLNGGALFFQGAGTADEMIAAVPDFSGPRDKVRIVVGSLAVPVPSNSSRDLTYIDLQTVSTAIATGATLASVSTMTVHKQEFTSNSATITDDAPATLTVTGAPSFIGGMATPAKTCAVRVKNGDVRFENGDVFSAGNITSIGSMNCGSPGGTAGTGVVFAGSLALGGVGLSQIQKDGGDLLIKGDAAFAVSLRSNLTEIIGYDASHVGVFGARATQLTAGPVTAGGTWGATEQTMLNTVYNSFMRGFGFST